MCCRVASMTAVLFITIVLALCWHSCVAEMSANGYFYDKPKGTLFDESPAQLQADALTAFPPVPTISNEQKASVAGNEVNQPGNIEIVPAQLVYQDTRQVNHGYQEQARRQPIYRENNVQAIASNTFENGHVYNSVFQGGQQGVNVFQQTQPVFSAIQTTQTVDHLPQAYQSDNTQAIAFHTVDNNQQQYQSSIQQPCGPEPIVAQVNANIIDQSRSQPIVQQITSCGPNNDCNTIKIQADPSRQLNPLPVAHYNGAVQGFKTVFEDQPRTVDSDIISLVRPPGRRLFEYTEEVVDVSKK